MKNVLKVIGVFILLSLLVVAIALLYLYSDMVLISS